LVSMAAEYIAAYVHGMRIYSKYCGTARQYIYGVIDIAATGNDHPNASPSWSVGDGDRFQLSSRWDICVADISTGEWWNHPKLWLDGV